MSIIREKSIGYATRPGYKQTEVGLIPVDWEVKRLGELIQRTEYGSSAKSKEVGKCPVLRMGNIEQGFFKWDNLVFTDDAHEIEKYQLEFGDVLFNRTNTADLVGKTAIFRAEEPAIFAGYLIRVVVNPSKLNSFYLNYILNTEHARLHSEKVLSIAVGQANINAEKLRGYPIPLPPTLAEQEAIAEALGDADAWIESLEQLVAKKRHLKQAAMQQLLTGKKRLPGFASSSDFRESEVGVIPNDWLVTKVESSLSDISMGPFGSDIKVSNFVSAGVPVLSGSNVRSERLADDFDNFVTPTKAKSLKKAVARRGDIVITHRGTLGQVSYIPEDSRYEQYVISQSQFRVRFNPQFAMPSWIVLYFHSERGARALLEKKGHTGVPAIAQPTTTFRSLYVPLPKVAEQQAITAVLADMDFEIEINQAKLAKARQIKQGMMQELLTGKTRLVKPGAAR